MSTSPSASGPGGRPRSGRVATVEKALAVDVVLRTAPGPMRLSDISRRAGLPKSTTHRMLQALVGTGAADRHGPCYVAAGRPDLPGPGTAPDREVLRALAPYVADLRVQTGLTASLAVLDGPDVLFVHRVHSHDRLRTAGEETGRAPALGTAAGRVLLGRDPGPGLRTDAYRGGGGPYRGGGPRRLAIREAGPVTCLAVRLTPGAAGPPVALVVRARTATLDRARSLERLRAVVLLAGAWERTGRGAPARALLARTLADRPTAACPAEEHALDRARALLARLG